MREMVEPLITQKVRDELYEYLINQRPDDKRKTADTIGEAKESLKKLHPIGYRILRYLVFHLQVIAAVKGKEPLKIFDV